MSILRIGLLVALWMVSGSMLMAQSQKHAPQQRRGHQRARQQTRQHTRKHVPRRVEARREDVRKHNTQRVEARREDVRKHNTQRVEARREDVRNHNTQRVEARREDVRKHNTQRDEARREDVRNHNKGAEHPREDGEQDKHKPTHHPEHGQHDKTHPAADSKLPEPKTTPVHVDGKLPGELPPQTPPQAGTPAKSEDASPRQPLSRESMNRRGVPAPYGGNQPAADLPSSEQKQRRSPQVDRRIRRGDGGGKVLEEREVKLRERAKRRRAAAPGRKGTPPRD